MIGISLHSVFLYFYMHAYMEYYSIALVSTSLCITYHYVLLLYNKPLDSPQI